jgi:hypothetical protein
MLNLVTHEILFGKDPNTLQEEIQQAKEELKDLELWRKKGPIGKLYNIVKYIRWSGQREQLFEKIQEIEISSLPVMIQQRRSINWLRTKRLVGTHLMI